MIQGFYFAIVIINTDNSTLRDPNRCLVHPYILIYLYSRYLALEGKYSCEWQQWHRIVFETLLYNLFHVIPKLPRPDQ